jgi:hypothetical protein
MTEVSEHLSEDLYEGESRVGRVSVDITVDVTRRENVTDVAGPALKRAAASFKREVQAIQDELDEEGEVDADA